MSSPGKSSTPRSRRRGERVCITRSSADSSTRAGSTPRCAPTMPSSPVIPRPCSSTRPRRHGAPRCSARIVRPSPSTSVRCASREASHPADRAALLDEYTAELLVVNRSADALEASTDAVTSWRAAGDRQRLAVALCRRARVLERVPDPDAALAAVRSAFALLEGSGDTPALARAHATLVWLFQRREERQQCVDAARVGFPVAERVGDEEATLEIMMSLGATELCLEDMGGWTRLDDALRRARAAGLDEAASMAMTRMVAYRMGSKDPLAALPLAQDALEVAIEPRSRVVGAVLALGRRGLAHRRRPSRRSGRGGEVARGADRSFRPVPLATTRCARPCGHEARGAGGARDARRPRREGQAL